MQTSIIERIVNWNFVTGLSQRPYDDFLESSFQIEEALEGLDLVNLGMALEVGHSASIADDAKSLSRYITSRAITGDETLADVDRLDKAIDALVYAVGSMSKLRLTADQITRAIHVVMDANYAKVGCEKDEHGKLLKPSDFPNPEPRLQEILDERVP